MTGGDYSSHGAERIRGRLGLPAKAVERQVGNALARGMKREKFKGPLRQYLDKLWRKGLAMQSATNIVVYQDNVFLFAGSVLVTAWPLPGRFLDGKEQSLQGNS